jgi:two-component system response regulator VicR
MNSNSGQKVLLLEDDPNLGLILQEHLEMQGFGVRLCMNGEDGLAEYHREKYDLMLVDVMMPKMDGFTFVRKVRAKDQDIPIIFLTAKSLKEDKIEGFKIGCDDYLTKPFSMEELLLRIQAVLKRSRATASADDLPAKFKIGCYTFDYNIQLLKNKESEYKLTPRESDLLRLLCLHMNRTLERNQALKKIWGDESYFSGRSMDVFISRLRKYLKDDPRIEIMGIHGKGFRLIVNK